VGSLEGRVVVLTGAAGGLGRAYARLFAREGARLVLNDVNADAAEALRVELAATGGDVVVVASDLSRASDSDDLVSAALDSFGALHVLINNAGVWHEGEFVESAPDDWDALVGVHVRAPLLAMRAAGRYWRDEEAAGRPRHGSVINTTSRSALNAISPHGAYAAAKAAITTASVVAAKEFAAFGARVNVVAPFARTDMTKIVRGLAGRLGEDLDEGAFDPWVPDHVAPALAYLATESCPLNGEVLYVHGGIVQRYVGWQPGPGLNEEHAWSVEDLAEELPVALGLDDGAHPQ
jgi:NAD(P)-dependent dehydrogenase (short-subunit alcohol dehydrogenase family)